jgi:hypothetical protein
MIAMESTQAAQATGSAAFAGLEAREPLTG